MKREDTSRFEGGATTSPGEERYETMTSIATAARPHSAMETRPAIIEIDNVVKAYDTGTVQVRALGGVSLTVRKGEMVAPSWGLPAAARRRAARG